jgi:hypothetical protein
MVFHVEDVIVRMDFLGLAPWQRPQDHRVMGHQVRELFLSKLLKLTEEFGIFVQSTLFPEMIIGPGVVENGTTSSMGMNQSLGLFFLDHNGFMENPVPGIRRVREIIGVGSSPGTCQHLFYDHFI